MMIVHYNGNVPHPCWWKIRRWSLLLWTHLPPFFLEEGIWMGTAIKQVNGQRMRRLASSARPCFTSLLPLSFSSADKIVWLSRKIKGMYIIIFGKENNEPSSVWSFAAFVVVIHNQDTQHRGSLGKGILLLKLGALAHCAEILKSNLCERSMHSKASIGKVKGLHTWIMIILERSLHMTQAHLI